MATIISIILMVLIFLISAIPLHIAVRLLGGRTSITWAALTNLIVGITGGIVYVFLAKYAAIVAFIILLLVYKFMFSLGWIRAFLAWLLQGVVIILLYVLFFVVLATMFAL